MKGAARRAERRSMMVEDKGTERLLPLLTDLCGALALGGGACNLADRMRRGYVTDYFSFNVPWKKLRGLVFNLSDMFIAVGALLTAIGMCRRK